jgi:Taurine catabolism dioxygenase TauD, TfdA family
MAVTQASAPHRATGRRAWRGVDQVKRKDWMLEFDDGERAEFGRATDLACSRRLTIDDVTRADFSLPTLGVRFAEVKRELAEGRGFVLLRGVPIAGRSADDVALMYCGIGAHLGVAVSQSAAGDRLGHVTDRGMGDKERYYTRGGALEFHMDPVDVVGLLCLRDARSGGASRIASALAVHNVILEERPDLLTLLYRGFHNSRRGHGEGTSPDRVPVFAEGGHGLECYLLPITIRQAIEEGYPLSAVEQEALEFVGEVADRPEMRLDMEFREGDIQFLNNRTILHARTDYVDDPDPALKRHLLRLWLMMPGWPPRASAMDFHGRVDRTGGGVRPRPTQDMKQS